MAERECSNCKHWSVHTNIGTCNASYSETDDDSLCDLYEAAPQPAALCGSTEVVEAVRAWEALGDGEQDWAENVLHHKSDEQDYRATDRAAGLLNSLRAATLRTETEVRADERGRCALECRAVEKRLATVGLGGAVNTVARLTLAAGAAKCFQTIRALGGEGEGDQS